MALLTKRYVAKQGDTKKVTPAYPWGSFLLSDGTTIDTTYVDGLSITYGNPRRHIWTYATGENLIMEGLIVLVMVLEVQLHLL